MKTHCDRNFLGWGQPALQSAAELLLGAAPGGDLANWLVVTPGGRASRLLLGALVEGGQLQAPPTFCTPGQVPDFLLSPPVDGTEPAGPLARRLAWVAALRQAPPRKVEALVPHRPDAGDFRAWWQIASLLASAQRELAGALTLFEEVAQSASQGGERFLDADRWVAAGAVQRAYERLLASRGLVDPELRVLRALRSEEAGLDDGGDIKHVVLVGAVELDHAVREAIQHFSAKHGHASVTSLIFAPEAVGDRFDELGAVVPERWAEAKVELPEVRFAEGAADQAQVVMEAIAGLEGRHAQHQIVVGVPDPDVTPFIERKAEQVAAVEVAAGRRKAQPLRVRDAAGFPLAQTAPIRLLRVLGDFVEHRSFASLAALVRHPDVEAMLLRQAEDAAGRPLDLERWLDEMDCYQAQHVPGEMTTGWHGDDQRLLRALREVEAGVGELAAPLLDGSHRRPLAEWTGPLRDVMVRIYGHLELSRSDPIERRTIEANIAIRDVLVELARLSRADDADEFSPVCTCREAIRTLLDIAATGAAPEEGDEESVELLGWLELLLDPAPAAIVTGLNEGRVPATIAGDAFLPDSLRERIGLASNRSRFARDLYILASLASSRQDLVLIAGRRASDGSPLAPSRLLFACEPAAAVQRVRSFTGDMLPAHQRFRLALRVGPGAESQFREMPLVATEPVTSMRVTAFRTFLSSPYLFYLQDVVGLDERDDRCLELDALAYGSLIHDVLERFGKSQVRHSADADVIESCLLDELSSLARARFGSEPPATIWLQLEFARRRLREFAQFQSQRRQAGWLIEHTEWRPESGRAMFVVDDEPFGLRGKIDRIERNESSGAWAVLDYKTGDEVQKPTTAHRGRAGWRDLQLPLYRHLAAQLGLPASDQLVLGYIALPRKPGGVQVLEADWTADDLAEADEVAREVIRRVRAGEFLDIGDRPPEDGTFAALCGVGFVGSGRRHFDEGEGGEP